MHAPIADAKLEGGAERPRRLERPCKNAPLPPRAGYSAARYVVGEPTHGVPNPSTNNRGRPVGRLRPSNDADPKRNSLVTDKLSDNEVPRGDKRQASAQMGVEGGELFFLPQRFFLERGFCSREQQESFAGSADPLILRIL